MNGAKLILRERHRQVTDEGWTLQHDDGHKHGELVEAAACYIEAAQTQDASQMPPPQQWNWDEGWWRPSDDPVLNLVKAGALLAAEIDRLQRARRVCPSARCDGVTDESLNPPSDATTE